jgi:uncharacterized RDD family membrane protein YckC
MACPRCGDICHCYALVRAAHGAPLRSRFELDSEDSSASVLVDPEQYDASEEQFSASLDSPTAPAARFIPDEPAVEEQTAASTWASPRTSPEPHLAIESESSSEQAPSACAVRPEEPASASTSDARDLTPCRQPSPNAGPLQAHSSSPVPWKEELAARLSTYRAKRKPKPPKYPSLSLDFEPAFPATSGSGARTPDLRPPTVEHRELEVSSQAPEQKARVVPADAMAPLSASALTGGRVIEFPRFFGPEEPAPDQLAEPVCEQPRILDAPDIELPAPALGGIVLDSDEETPPQERPGFEVPLRSASISRRLVAATIDAAVILSAAIMFADIFLQLVKVLPPVPHLLASATLVLGLLWTGYQYLLLTYSGTTPGMRLAKLQLAQFDGSAVFRSTRKWRVLASLLSGVSLGLGFAWCFLDEDALCWHDRITRTHLVPRD